MLDKQWIREEVLKSLGYDDHTTDEAVYREIDRVILREGHSFYGSLEEKRTLREDIFNSIRRMDILEKYLKDDHVTEIMVTGRDRVFVERDGTVYETGEHFQDESEIHRLIDQMVAETNRMVNESNPIVDSRLPDGSRVHIVLPPISLSGPVITIRKFQKGGMTVDKLIQYGEFPAELAPVLYCLVRGRYSILIDGATNSGKSSLLNALASYIEPDERIITIEDSAELQFHMDNLVRLETREANVEGEGSISMEDLIKASLRMRPSRIIVGEVRGREAVSMLMAFSTGHIGSLSSIHANSCRDALRRLETMTLMGMDMPLRAVQGLIASSIDILIHLGRLPSGKRKLIEISEIIGYDGQDYQLNPLFQYEFGKGEEGVLMKTGELHHKERMKGYQLYETYCQAVETFG
ncbi:MAG: CpaF family protein [Eubacterium sp.]|nr:CpaF family protein [Eubacterium sp.]